MGSGLSKWPQSIEAREHNQASVEASAKFRLGRHLTENGVNEVREAEDLMTGRRCVVKKVTRPSREAETLAKLKHTNIITLYEVIREKESDTLVMEWASHGSLFDYVCEKGCPSEANAALFAKHALTGLAHCHEAGFVHRGIRPEHCLLSTSGQDELVLKLTGFDTAIEVPVGTHVISEPCGTPGYIAPEVLSRRYGKPSDVWSLGAVVFVLLSGHPPFYGENDAEILNQTRLGRLRFDSPRWNEVSVAARDFIGRAMTVNPATRWTVPQLMHHEWLQA